MNTCKTCKWWDTEAQTRFDDNTFVEIELPERICLCPKIVSSKSDFERWDKSQYSDGYQPISGDEARSCDGSGFMAVLKTCPDFGCVHHEPKETQ